MAKPIELITVFSGKEAEIFIEDIKHPKPNPARDRMLKFSDDVGRQILQSLDSKKGKIVTLE